MSEPSELVANPSTSPEVLGRLAYEHPELQPQIVAHPRVYAELLQWISLYGTPAGKTAAANRLSPTQAGPPPPPGASATVAPTPMLADESPAAQSVPSGALPVPAATATVERVGAKTRRFPWAMVAAVVVFALILGAFWFGPHRAAEETNAELEVAVADLNAAVDAIEQARRQLSTAKAEIDAEDRGRGVSLDGLGTARQSGERSAETTLLLVDARSALAAAEEPGGDKSQVIEEARRVTVELNEHVIVLDEFTEEIRDRTAELLTE